MQVCSARSTALACVTARHPFSAVRSYTLDSASPFPGVSLSFRPARPMDPNNWQESQERDRHTSSRTTTAPSPGLRFPLKERYLRMFDQPHSSAHIQRLARAYEALPHQRQPSSSSQALDSLSTGLYGSLPSAGHGFSMSPQSYGPWTTELSSLGWLVHAYTASWLY